MNNHYLWKTKKFWGKEVGQSTDDNIADSDIKNDVGGFIHKKKPNINGIRFGIWLYFMLFALCILAVMWLFQFVFAKSYYNNMRIDDIKKLCDTSVKSFIKNKVGDTDSDLASLATTNGFNIYVFGITRYQCLFGIDSNGQEDKEVAAVSAFDFPEDLYLLEAELKTAKNLTICDTVEDADSAEKAAIRYAKLFSTEGNTYVYFAYVPLYNMASTMSIMAMQLLIVTAVAMILSFAAAALLSAQLSRPIEKMSRSAAKLAMGNYDVRFAGNGYTEIDNLSDSLNFATSELARAETTRKDVMANVSHDLRTPLTLIRSYAEMIRDLSGDNKEKREKHINTIIYETDRLAAMVNDILKLAKSENTEALQKEVYNLSAQLAYVVDIYRESNPDILFECDIDKDLYVEADKQKMSQVFNNFISNAVKYGGDGKKIRLVLKAYGNNIRFDIFDKGIGISAEEQPYIWDRFTKASLKHQRGDSNGLGLSIVKNILVKHGAKYGVHSVLHKGSNFFFELPHHEKIDINNNEQ